MVPQGEGLYLKAHRGAGLSSLGDGLYIKSGTGFIDGCTLLVLGQNNPFQMYSKTYPFSGQYLEQFCEHNKKWKANKQTRFVYNISVKLQKQSTMKEGNKLISVKKYHTCVKVVTIVDNVLAGFTMVLGSVGITLLPTAAITSSVMIAIEATALATGIIRVAGGQKVIQKMEKHEKIRVLTESTLSTISGYVSKALNDEKITDE